jgi:hypothetical protein
LEIVEKNCYTLLLNINYRAEGVDQMVECLLEKSKALSLITSNAKISPDPNIGKVSY